jgi:hypothetical protein
VPPVRTSGDIASKASGEPVSSIATSTPRPPVAEDTQAASSPGGTVCVAPKVGASERRWGSRSQAMTLEAPSAPAQAQAVTPSIPQPMTRTDRSASSPAASIAPATVAVAQLAGQAASSGSRSGTRKIAEPGANRPCSASPPVSSRRGARASCPYFTRLSHFWGSDRRQKKHPPQLATIAQVTRSPG